MSLADFLVDQLRRSRTSDIAGQVQGGQLSPQQALIAYAQATGDPNALQQGAQQQIQGGVDPNDPGAALKKLAPFMKPEELITTLTNPANYGMFNGGNTTLTNPQPNQPATSAPSAPSQPAVDSTIVKPETPDDTRNYNYLNTAVPPTYRNIVKAIAEGDEAPAALNRLPAGQVETWARNFDPTFTTDTYATRKATKKDYSVGGSSSKSIVAGEAALQHLAEWTKNVNSLNNADYRPRNYVKNLILDANSYPPLAKAESDSQTLASELATFYKGGQPAEGEIQGFRDKLSLTGGKDATNAIGNEIGTLMKGKISALRDQYNTAMGRDAASKRDIFSRKTLDALEKLGVDTSDIIQPNNPPKEKPAASPAAEKPKISADEAKAELRRRGLIK